MNYLYMFVIIINMLLGTFCYACAAHTPAIFQSEPIHDAPLNDTSLEVANIMGELHTPATYPPPKLSFLSVKSESNQEDQSVHSLSDMSNFDDAFDERSFYQSAPRLENKTQNPRATIDANVPNLPRFDRFIQRRGSFQNPPSDIASQEFSRSQNASHERRSLSVSQKISIHNPPLADYQKRELSSIPKIAPVLPSECVQKFKNSFVSCAGILSMLSLIISRLSYVASGVILSDYGFDLNYISVDLRTKIIVFSGISGFVFDHIKQVLQLAQLRDELYLISYERKKEENAFRLENGEDHFFNTEEIIKFLKSENEFACLPQKRELKFRKFALNSMCILESFLGIGVSFFSGFSAMFITSGVTSSNVLGLSIDENRKLMIFFSTITAAMMALEYYQSNLKKMCEKWIQNYERLYFYFVYMCHIQQDDVMKSVRYVPLALLSKKLQTQIEKVDHVAINIPPQEK